MLSIEKINFPITFKFYKPDMQVTFTSKTRGEWEGGGITGFKLEYFVNKHNNKNPDNIPGKDGYYEIAEPRRERDDHVDALQYLLSRGCELFIGDVKINNELIDDPVKAETETFCNIEDMPVGATILAIKRNDEGWYDVIFTPRRIEVHDDTITLLSGYACGSMPKRTQTYAAELNIKRGTLVKYSTNC